MGRTKQHCFVPHCTASSFTTPNKRFLTVPRKMEVRRLWFKAARRHSQEVSRSSLYCCQDHFNLEKDLENYEDFLNKKPAKFKRGVVPHKCILQKNVDGEDEEEPCDVVSVKTDTDMDTPTPVTAMSEDNDDNCLQSTAELLTAQVAAVLSVNPDARLMRPILPKPLPQKRAEQNKDKEGGPVRRKCRRHIKSLTLEEKMKILKMVEAGVSGKLIVKEFNIKLQTFSNIKKNAKLIKDDAQTIQALMTGMEVEKTKKRPISHAALGEEVFKWYLQEGAAGVHVSGKDIQNAAARLAKQLNISNFKASAGWLRKFQTRYSLADFGNVERSEVASEAAALPFMEELHGTVLPPSQYAPARLTSPETNKLLAPTEAVYIVERPTDGGTVKSEEVDLEEHDPWESQSSIEDPHTTTLVYTTPTQSVQQTTSLVYTTPNQNVLSQSAHNTPNQSMDTTPSQSMDVTPSRPMDTTPSQSMDVTPSRPMDTTPSQSVCSTLSQSVCSTSNQCIYSTSSLSVYSTSSRSMNSTPSPSVHSAPSQSTLNTSIQSVQSILSHSVRKTLSQSAHNNTSSKSVRKTLSKSVRKTQQSVHNNTPSQSAHNNTPIQSAHNNTPSPNIHSSPSESVHQTPTQNVYNQARKGLQPRKSVQPKRNVIPKKRTQPRKSVQPKKSVHNQPRHNVHTAPSHSVQNYEFIDLESSEDSNTCEPPTPAPPPPPPALVLVPAPAAPSPAPAAPSPAPAPEQNGDLQNEIRQELREMKRFIGEMRSSMKSMQTATKDTPAPPSPSLVPPPPPPAPPPPAAQEQPGALQQEMRQELREMKHFMGEMSSSMRSIHTATRDIADTLKVIANTFCNGIR